MIQRERKGSPLFISCKANRISGQGAPLAFTFEINEKGLLKRTFREPEEEVVYFDLLATANFMGSFFSFYSQLRNVALLKDTAQKVTLCG
jgi:hypothetical protein